MNGENWFALHLCLQPFAAAGRLSSHRRRRFLEETETQAVYMLTYLNVSGICVHNIYRYIDKYICHDSDNET